MLKTSSLCALLSAALLSVASAQAVYAATGPAATPPMGWNSWDAYGTTVTETQVKANADAMADKLKPSIRQAAAIALVAIGALAAAPWLVKITLGQINRPESEWGSRARLRSIRGDSGYTSDTDIY